MNKIEIITDSKKLSQISEPVPFGVDVSDLVLQMKNQMIRHKGIGLAAIQIGFADRVIAINTDRCQMVVINPVLSDGKYSKKSKEECLSVPNRHSVVDRFNHIVISGFDENWKPIEKKLRALSAFVAQHEVDHLNGITI